MVDLSLLFAVLYCLGCPIGKHCQENNVASTNVDRRTVLAGGAGLALSLINGSRLAGSALRIESIEAFWLHDG